MKFRSATKFNDEARKSGWPGLCDPSANFTHPDLRRLLGVWRRLAKPGGFPRLGDVTPRLFRSFLSDIVIYETVPQDGRRWRSEQAGTSFAQIMGDSGGEFLDKTVAPDLLPRWNAALDAALEAGAPLRFLARIDTNRMTFLTGEFFTAPLLAADGSASFILASGRFTGGRPWEVVEAEARQALGQN